MNPELLVLHLQALDGARFASLGAQLLSEAAARAGIDRLHLDLTANVTDPDGGVDARCRGAPHRVARLIPADNDIYQFKGGARRKTAPAIAREDIARKPRVRDALAAGETLVYVAAADYGPEVAARVRTRLDGEHHLVIRADQLVIINGRTLAEALQAYPALVRRFLGLDVQLHALEQWARFPRLTNAFQADADLEARLEGLRAQIRPQHSMVRVVGAAGHGKTRDVLETLRPPELASDVLYALEPDDVSASVWTFLQATPDAQCALVVDEVDDADAARFTDLFALTQPGVRLVMIGRDASGRAQAGTVQVQGLSEDLLVRAIRDVAPGLPEDAARRIAVVCERSPKLAILLADRAREDPRRVERLDPGLQSALDLFLPLDDPDLQALSSLALLEHVGWNGAVDEESALLFGLLGLDPTDARRRIERLDARLGIAPLAGRYRYVSPDILADHLAAGQVGAWTRDRVRQVVDALPAHMAASFGRRVRRLADVLRNREAVEEVILGDQGPFRSLADIEDRRLGALLSALAGPFRRASLRTLRRMIEPASDEELRAATTARRPLVYALEELIWPEDTFEEAARLLLRLAASENEGFANNATGMFVETFQTVLGRTEAGLEPRARVLRRAATSDHPREREIAAQALGAAVKTGHLHRMGMPPRDVAGMPEREWRPATWKDWFDAIESYLDILTPLLRDPDGSVRTAAIKALCEAADVAAEVSRVTAAWIAAARTVVGGDFDERAKVLEALELEFDRDRLRGVPKDRSEADKAAGAERIAKLRDIHRELLGGDFSSRFRRAVTRAAWSGLRRPLENEQERIREVLESIAADILRDPGLLDDQRDWLLQRQGRQAEYFFELLGRADRERRLAATLAGLAQRHTRAMGWLSLYELGYADATKDPAHIDRLAGTLRGDPGKAAQLFDLLLRAGPSPERVAIVTELLEAGTIPRQSIASFGYGKWRTALSPDEARALGAAAAVDPEAVGAVITFLAHYLYEARPQVHEILRDLVLRVLTQPRRTDERRQFDDEWDRLAKEYVGDAPLQVGAAVLQDVAAREFAHDREIGEVLRQAWAATDKRRFFTEVLAPWLDAETTGAWWVRQVLEHFPVDEVGVDFLVEWVAAKPDPRARALADILSQPLGRPSDLQAALLERFDEHGVGDAFFGGLISGTWTGSASGWSQGRLAEAKKWLEDERPAVRKWAERAVASLEQMVEHDLVRDAEERVRR